MMMVMESITNKPDWHLKVFDNGIVTKWKEEALMFPNDDMYDEITDDRSVWAGSPHPDGNPARPQKLLDEACLDYCIQELRVKAEFFKNSGLVPTLDATASVTKSDTIIGDDLRKELCAAFEKLKDEQEPVPDWHPGSNERVQDLVHPSMYPLVYGRTRVIRDEVVGIDDAISTWAGKGDVIARSTETDDDPKFPSGKSVDPPYWSADFQWLPSNVKFQDDGSVRFTSYINNLHPTKHRDIYHTIEKLVQKAIPAWDLCLAQARDFHLVGLGRTKPRFPKPESPCDSNSLNWDPPVPEEVEKCPDTMKLIYTSGTVKGRDPSDNEYDYNDYSDPRVIRWSRMRRAVQPSPPPFEPWPYGAQAKSSGSKTSLRLQEQFKDTGLQIIVKMASAELTPDNNVAFPLGSWHVEGQMNEHIVGTALYYLDSDNITPSSLEFRMTTDMYQDELQGLVDQDSYSWLNHVYGTEFGVGSLGACLQNYGRVETREGRLLAFPNVFHHRVTPFELADTTKPGHRRFIALWLVDPFTRILSTANVPPQQESWVPEEEKGSAKFSGLMTIEEAKRHRENLIKERSVFRDEAEGSWI
ncbi:hypothetical protein FALBO_16757, partial [Fusarium albosuccineum]